MAKQKTNTMNTKKAIMAGICAGVVVAAANILIMTATKPASAEMAATKFCRAYQANSDWRMKMIMTEDLKDQWRAAEKQNTAIQRARPGEKPPLGDGIPVASFQDSMPECAVGKITQRGDGAIVSINHIDPAKPASNWTDRIVVKKEGTAYLIDDVTFPSHGGSLRAALNRTIKTPVPESEMAADEAAASAEPAAGNPTPAPAREAAPAQQQEQQPQQEVIHWNTNN